MIRDSVQNDNTYRFEQSFCLYPTDTLFSYLLYILILINDAII